MEIKGASIIVTGGCGFIGGNLVKALIDLGADVTVLDILLNPQSIFAQKKLKKLTRLYLADIRHREKVINIFKKNKPSYIVHLAAEPIVQNSYNDPYKTFETNIMGTVNILDAAQLLNNLKGIIVASSDKAYGKSNKAYRENMPLKGDHPYDVSKSCEDLIAQAYYKTYGLPIVVTRFGNVYGEGDLHFGRIIPDICYSVIEKKTLPLRSNGTYVRDYVYVEDVVNGYIILLKNIEKAKGEAFNFSSKDTLSVIEVVKKAEKIFKVKIPYKIFNDAKNEIPYQHLDDRKVKRLGWNQHCTLENSLEKVFDWYRNLSTSFPI